MRPAPRTLFAGLIAALGLALAACGSSSGLLSAQQASSLNAGLDQIRSALNQHDCSAAQSEAITLKSRVADLPSSVDGTVRSSLTRAAGQLEQLVSQDCAPVTTNAQPETTPTTQTTTTATTTTTSPPPQKKPKPHTTPATTPTQTGTTTGPAPGSGNGNGKGNGGGDGNGHGGGSGHGGGDPTTPTTPTTQPTPGSP